jgi:hypothetical protein
MNADLIDELKLEYEIKAKKLNIQFELVINNILFESLGTFAVQHIKAKNYSIIELDLEKVVEKLPAKDKIRIYKRKLFDDTKHYKIFRLIDFIEIKNNLFPVVIDFIDEKTLTIRDGYHRMILLNFLNYKRVPFMVHNNKVEIAKDFFS